jgi:hypothetical protein
MITTSSRIKWTLKLRKKEVITLKVIDYEGYRFIIISFVKLIEKRLEHTYALHIITLVSLRQRT